MQRTVLTLIVAATCLSAAASDFNQLPPGKWWENQRVVERIALSEAQQKEIAALVYQHALKMIDLKAAMERAGLTLKQRSNQQTIDPDEMRAAFGDFQTARKRLESERFEMLLSVRQTLSFEQWQQLQSLREAFERRRKRQLNGDPRPGVPPGSERRGPERPMGR